MTIRAVIFDIGGVLMQEVGGGVEQKWATRLGMQQGDLLKSLISSGIVMDANLGRITEQELWQRIGALLGLDETQMREFADDNWSMYQLNTELAQFLKSLRPRYKTATLSNDWPGAREKNDLLFNLNKVVDVDVMLYSAEEGMQKPEARFYQLACEWLGVQPEEAVFLDDIGRVVEAACRLGMWGIQFKSTAQAIADVRAYLEAHGCG